MKKDIRSSVKSKTKLHEPTRSENEHWDVEKKTVSMSRYLCRDEKKWNFLSRSHRYPKKKLNIHFSSFLLFLYSCGRPTDYVIPMFLSLFLSRGPKIQAAAEDFVSHERVRKCSLYEVSVITARKILKRPRFVLTDIISLVFADIPHEHDKKSKKINDFSVFIFLRNSYEAMNFWNFNPSTNS